MRKLFITLFAICAVTTQADTFTDGIAKAIDDGLISITFPQSPILDELVDRNYDERKQGAIEYLALIFHDHMTEDEFKAWLEYKPSKAELKYEKRLRKMLKVIEPDTLQSFSIDSTFIYSEVIKKIPVVEAKSCPPGYQQAYNEFLEANNIGVAFRIQRKVAFAFINLFDPNNNFNAYKVLDAYEKYLKNSTFNNCLDHYNDKQLRQFSKELPFDKKISDINVDLWSGSSSIMEASLGMRMEQFQKLLEDQERLDSLKRKYNNQGREITIQYRGAKRTKVSR